MRLRSFSQRFARSWVVLLQAFDGDNLPSVCVLGFIEALFDVLSIERKARVGEHRATFVVFVRVPDAVAAFRARAHDHTIP
jgi:hypothetical protein